MNQKERKENVKDLIEELTLYINSIDNVFEKNNAIKILQMLRNKNPLEAILKVIFNHINNAKSLNAIQKRNSKLIVWSNILEIFKKHLDF